MSICTSLPSCPLPEAHCSWPVMSRIVAVHKLQNFQRERCIFCRYYPGAAIFVNHGPSPSLHGAGRPRNKPAYRSR